MHLGVLYVKKIKKNIYIYINFGKVHVIKFTILTIFKLQLSDIKGIHIVVQPSLPPISRKKS